MWLGPLLTAFLTIADGENRSVAIPNHIQMTKSKYQRWYEALCDKARNRDIPTSYTEVHHIKPRSLGGSDDPSNLVRLTYREHFIAHWLLTKFHTGRNLQKMQKALWAVTLTASGERNTAGWQVEAAKRAVRDMELEDDDAAYLERWRQKKQEKIDAHNAKESEKIRKWNEEQIAEALFHADWYQEPKRSEVRDQSLAIFRNRWNTKFHHQLIAKYSKMSREELDKAYHILKFGWRSYLGKRHRLANQK